MFKHIHGSMDGRNASTLGFLSSQDFFFCSEKEERKGPKFLCSALSSLQSLDYNSAVEQTRTMSFFTIFSLETWILLITFICISVKYCTWTFGIFERIGIPGPKPMLFFGTVLRHNPVYYIADYECAQKYGRIWGMFEFRKPVLAVTDPNMLKTIMVKECFTYFTNHRNFRLNGELYDAISIAEDDKWKQIRNILSPSFTSGRIKEMFSIMKQQSHKLTTCLGLHSDEVITVKDFFGSYSISVAASCILSVDVQSDNPSNPFITHSANMIKFSIPLFMFQGMFPIFLPVLELLGVSFFPKTSTAFFKRIVEKVRAERNGSSHQKSRDILQNMINSQTTNEPENEKKKKGLTDHEIVSQVCMLMFGSYETSSTTLVFLAYNLAKNPAVMKRLQEEIDLTFPNKGPVQYEALMQMEYLDSVVHECLRLCPPSPRIERVAKETVKINGITIPKGMLVMIPVYALHRDPELWPEPEEFRPDRFSKENKQSINPYTYLTFGIGPRSCLGMRLALAMVKLALVEVLQNYSFSVCEETEIPLKMSHEGLLGPQNPIKLKVMTRSSE